MEDFYVQKRTMQWKIPGSGRMWRGKTQDIEIKEGGIHCVPCASSSVLGAAIEVFLTKLGGVMTLKNFSSLGWRNRVLFLRARLQVKPEFPRRGASR